MINLTPEQQILSFFLPEGTLNYFDVVSAQRDDKTLRIILKERDEPPLEEHHRGKEVKFLDFRNISIVDYPARGRSTLLTFKRRRWKVGTEVLKRVIELRAPGTTLSKEFGRFLKERG